MEYEQINRLKNSFESIKEKRTYYRDSVIFDDDKVLAISDLWSRILFSASKSTTIIDRDKVSELKREVESSTGKNIDLESIHDKYWIRYCLNEVIFPESIRHQLKDFDKVEVFKNELEFIAYVRNKANETRELRIEKSTLNKLLENHCNIYPKFQIEDFRNTNFKEKDDFYYLENNHKYYELADAIGGKLWNLYIEENFSINNNVFFDWLRRISFINDDFWNCTDYMTSITYNYLLDIAFDLIEKESDIIGWGEECKKLYWENNHYIPLDSTKFIELPEPEDTTSLYRKFLWLSDLSQLSYNYPFIGSRENIRFLIHILIRDAAKNGNKRFTKLLDLSKNRPFLLDNVIFSIYNTYPELIPTLLVYEPTISVGMALIKKVRLHSDTIDELDGLTYATKLFKKSFDLALYKIRKLENKTSLLYEIIIDLMKDYYFKPNQSNQIAINQKEEINNRLEYVLNLISEDNIIEEIYNDFVSQIYQNTLNNVNEFGYLQVPDLKILFWLLSVCEKKNSPDKEKQLTKTTNCIYDIYTNEINRLETIKYGEKKIVKWYRDQEEIETLSWEAFFIHLDSRKLISLYSLYSNIEVNIPEKFEDGTKNRNYYDDTVQTIAYKIRLNLCIFIHARFNLKGSNHNDLILSLENTISNLISWYCYDDFKDNKINIFDSHYELSRFGNFTYDFAAKIGKLLNIVSNKYFINSIINNSSNIGFLARTLKNTVSESDRKQLLAKVDESNIKEYLKNVHTTTEIQQLLIDLSEEKDKVSLLPEIIEFGDKHYNPNNKDWKKFSYTYKLLVAAQTGNMNDIESIHDNNKDIINSFTSNSKKEYEDTYWFYKALCAYNTNPEEGYKLYNKIVVANKKNVTAVLNRFASKIKWALQAESNKIILLQSAIEEWEEYEQSCSIDELKSVQENSILNKLICYYHLNKVAEFENLWENLSPELQYSFQLIEVRIGFLKGQWKEKDLDVYISEIINFHKDSNGNLPEEIEQLIEDSKRQKLTIESNIAILPNEDIKGLSDAYIQINKREIDDFIKIIKSRELDNEVFCVKHLLLPTLEKILDQKIIFRGRDGENKYTQLVSMLIDEKFSFFDNWVIRTQPPGGESETTFGEKDLVIEHQKHPITIIEALRLDGLNTPKIEDHIERFDRYDNIGLLFYVVLTYYEKKDGFHDNWEKYKEVVRCYDFKKTKLKSKGNLEELPHNWQRGNIRIAKTDHIRNDYHCNMYHVFVDFGS
ncbi:hypothetical protein [Draconibacterium orientale]|uniref:hypothetical protein n=1 Tax=Draconibacterium orientale TaxID=1168034 RepID=UPI0029C05C1D|nr:hypothetical protein [Draconibacterium orientale]